MLLVVTMLAVHCTLAWPALILGGFVAYACIWELADLLGINPKWTLMAFAVFAGFVMISLTTKVQPPLAGLLGSVIGVAALLRRIISKAPSGTDAASVFWIVAPIVSAIQLQSASSAMSLPHLLGPNLVLLAAGPLWIGDTAALVVGRAWGKHPLAPNVSPNKTWEGAVANFVASALTGAILSLFIGPPVYVGAAVGALAGITGQIGDLLQSALKRSVDKKDSGGILPGHGGLLDRMDSFLVSFPFSFLLITWLVPATR